MNTHSPFRKIALAAAGALAFCAVAASANAQNYPSGDGPSSDIDQVTGYKCVDNWCTVLRLPNANCICTKQNPGELNVTRLRLSCKTNEGGQWVSCPVPPRYGISVN